MKFYKTFVLIIAILVHTSPLMAAPTDPIASLRVPDKTKWITTVESSKSPPTNEINNTKADPSAPKTSSTRALAQTICEKNNGLYRVISRYTDQTTEEFWISPHMQYLKTSGREGIARLLPTQSRAWNVEEADFPELYWAVGQVPQLQEIKGQKSLVITMDAARKPLTKRRQRDLEEMKKTMEQTGEKVDLTAPAEAGTLVLYLDPTTRLPMRFEDNGFVYRYSYEKSSGLESAVPDDIKKEMARSAKELAEISRPASAPKIRNPQKQIAR